MKLAHISITARCADRLVSFYRDVFGCEEMRSPRTLSGEAVSRGNGLRDCVSYSIWLRFPQRGATFQELEQPALGLD